LSYLADTQTEKQTNKQTNKVWQNITSLAEVIIYLLSKSEVRVQ